MERRVIQIRYPLEGESWLEDDFEFLINNWEPFAGSGRACVASGGGCGDGGTATTARLAYPKVKEALNYICQNLITIARLEKM